MTKIIPFAYFVTFVALVTGTLPAGRFLFDIGWNLYFIAFVWIIVTGCFSWSITRYLMDRRFW
jgi:hypothetical protein